MIKVERAGEGDDTRRAPFQLEEGRDDQSTYFIRCNVGKRSVGVDLEHPGGREVVRDLVHSADVLVENFLPGVMARLGFDYPTLARLEPGLVYCSISGFGQTGPLRDQPAFAFIVGALSGLVHLEQADEPAPPVPYLQAADVLAGTHAFGAILAALWRRARTGRGAYVDVSMLECLVAAEDITFGSVLNGGPEYRGPRAGMMVHEIGGRHLALQIVGTLRLWPRLVAAMEQPALRTDPRFATPIKRREHWRELRPLIEQWLARFSSVEAALEALQRARIPAAPVLSPAAVVAHPHLAARKSFPAVPHPARGEIRVPASPFHLDGRPVGPTAPAPYRVGEHTREVLTEVLGYAKARVDELLEAGAIAAP